MPLLPAEPLVAFLLERIAEDEEVARAATQGTTRYPRWTAEPNSRPEPGCRCLSCYETIPGSWDVYPIDGPDCPDHDCFHTMTIGEADAAHIARHDPVRVLTECAIKRRLIERHARVQLSAWAQPRCHNCWENEAWPCTTLRLLAEPYRDHTDYDQEWSV